MKKKKIGRPAKIEDILKVQRLRAKGVSFRDIQKVMDGKDLKTLSVWAKYSVGETVDK